MTKTIVLIHGAWLNSRSWENVKARYEAQGFNVIVPDWPFDNRSPAELRANPDVGELGEHDFPLRPDHVVRSDGAERMP